MKSSLEAALDEARSGSLVIPVSGLTSPSARAYFAARAFRELKRKVAFITASNAEAENYAAEIETFAAMNSEETPSVAQLPAFEGDPYSGTSPHAGTKETRALTLFGLANNAIDIVVLPVRSLLFRTPTPDEILELGITIKAGDWFEPADVRRKLIAAGYLFEDPVASQGQYSFRGGIVDIWPAGAEDPVRVEFFGDEVESLRSFDPETQRSVEHIAEVVVPPMREFSVSEKAFSEWANVAKSHWSDPKYGRNLADRNAFAKEGEDFSGWEYLLPLIRPLSATASDHLHGRILIFDEPSVIETTVRSLHQNLAARFEAVDSDGDIALDPKHLFLSGDELRDAMSEISRFELRSLGRTDAAVDSEFEIDGAIEANSGISFLFVSDEVPREVELRSKVARKYRGDIAALAADLKKESSSPRFVLETIGMAERLAEVLGQYGVNTSPTDFHVGHLASGFSIPEQGVSFLSETDIFGETVAAEPAETKRRKSRLGAFISDFRDLKPGDFVVHVDHGIGRFSGLETITTQGSEREFMLLVYADEAKLFVPVERADLISRYSSGEATAPTLDRLGGIGWQKTKAKAKRAMRDMADELLKLYAERKLVTGHAFPPDMPWQHEFEDAFPYDLTADQAAAIEDVKGDMETPSPMDRLIIGDVGYGKTEVAMRAVFKAVMDGKQAAILSPTTVLAYQHFETFKKRFAAFPIKVELLSRFRTAKEQKRAVELAAGGEIDVLIGTHRILSADVKLPKLGLVVIDEEQRFGVGHKEKLKQLKKKIDVLTLSATPIPRTLNMSLLGMRDMSVIETPPRDRLAINTQVVQFSESVIRSAIELELSRSGQVFFIHNRVESIESIAALIGKIVPEARIAIGHGQMNESEMENVMLDFIDYKYDVLVATTIIENGIDIPRANTIIINRADNYGLSQLYQLRGRVGRSNRRAYAYLLIPSELELTPIARRRLSAIREFSDLGAGFRLAALDLELRGAGNILGGQQSGHLDALGFDLYTKMLERTIAELKGEEVADEVGVSINLGVDVSIPKAYIQEASQRLRTYKRIANAETPEAVDAIRGEIEDRYGRLPEQVENLLEYGRLRQLAERIRVLSIDKAAGSIAIKFTEASRIDPEKLLKELDEAEGTSFSPNGIFRTPMRPDETALSTAIRTLNALAA
ncbi:MAG: transcription-repair coupling factor [Acidobacteria bacterium OLB17]|nr:MAG: transcription-repair coupling factor [Acidobacteria bacterium OLB17]MCZ2391738.1 transcription-repair coupling factor [Acidobacteriota bacterium]